MAHMRATLRSVCCLSYLARQRCLLDPRSALLASKLTTLPRYLAQKSSEPILTHSTLMQQDGLDIQEIPMVIRRLTGLDIPLPSADTVRHVTEEDTAFQLRLQACVTVPQVLSLLEVPGKRVTSYSAAFALQRLGQLQEASYSEIDSFLRKAVLNELCNTVTRDLASLTSETLVNLVRCYLKSSNYAQEHIDLINQEVERRLGDATLSVRELCTLIEVLSVSVKGDQAVIDNIWIHLATRSQDIEHTNITRMYEILRYRSPQQKYMLQILAKKLRTCWWYLESVDIATIMKTLCHENHRSVPTLTLLGKWLFMNIQEVSETHLWHILGTYRHFKYMDRNFMNALERYLVGTIGTLNKTIVGMSMDYCRECRYLSPRIFDAVATDFRDNVHLYDTRDMVYTLRTFGELNYVPARASLLFQRAEDVLTEKFAEVEAPVMAQLLASFVYLQRLPINFVDLVYSPHFLNSLRDITDATTRHRAFVHIMEVQAAVLLEFEDLFRDVILGNTVSCSVTALESRHHVMVCSIHKLLVDLLGRSRFRVRVVPNYTPYVIDFEICLDEESKAVKTNSPRAQRPAKKLALVIVMPEHYTVNFHHMLGQYATKKRHLVKLGYTVVEVPYLDFIQRKPKKTKQLYELLSQYMKLDNMVFNTEEQ